MLLALHKQFLLSYARLPPSTRHRLAYEDALAQELENYRSSVKATYKNLSITSVARLKKRSVVLSEADDHRGSLGEERKKIQEREEREKGRLDRSKLARFISTQAVLEAHGYLLAIPQENTGGHEMNDEGKVRVCERRSCGVEFLVKAVLDEVSLGSPNFYSTDLVADGRRRRLLAHITMED